MRRKNSLVKNRGLAEFLGEECVENFFEHLFNNNIRYGEDDKKIIFSIVKNIDNNESLIHSLEILIKSERLQKTSKKQNKVQEYLIRQYEQGSNGEFFKQFFSFINNYPYIWLEGTGRIGVRASHILHPSSGVSIFTIDEDNIVIYKKR